jgi:hypothetical protein
MMNRCTAPALAIAALLALPAAGHASQSFGSLLKNSPAPGPDPCVETVPGPCTLVGYINPNDAGDPVTSPAPADGVVVKFRIRSSAADSVTFRLANIDKQGDTALAKGAGVGPTVTLQGSGEIEEYAARVPVAQGAHVALDAPAAHAVYNQGGNKFTYLYGPPLAEGQGPRSTGEEPTGELLVQAVVEPDADKDGFGDETQDGCPTQASTQGVCDNAAPDLDDLSVSGGNITYRLSEAATLRFRLEKFKHGRYVKVRTLTRTGSAGKNVVRIGRRFGGRKLSGGRYRVTVIAVDAAGNRSVVRRLRFRVRHR